MKNYLKVKDHFKILILMVILLALFPIFSSKLLNPAWALTADDISINHYSSSGNICNEMRSFGWSEINHGRKYWKNFVVRIKGLEKSPKYTVKILSNSDEEQQTLLLQNTFRASPRSNIKSFTVSKKFIPLPFNKKISQFNLVVIINSEGTTVTEKKTYLRFNNETAVVWNSDENKNSSCYLTTEAIPVSGIISNHNSERIKEVSYSSSDDEVNTSSRSRENGTLLSAPCALVSSACFGISNQLINNLVTPLIGAKLPFDISFIVGLGFSNNNSVTSFYSQESSMEFNWKLRKGEAGMIFKQYLLRKGDLQLYRLDDCGVPTSDGLLRNILVNHWAYDFIILEEEKLADPNYLRSTVNTKLPLINTCK